MVLFYQHAVEISNSRYFRWPSFQEKHVDADRNRNDQAFRRSKITKGRRLRLATVLLRKYPAPHPPRLMVDRC
eukprot:6213397-Pleurochrysis_carterae.AAC.3